MVQDVSEPALWSSSDPTIAAVSNVKPGHVTGLKAGTYTSLFPISSHRERHKNASHLRHLDGLVARLRELERRLLEPQEGKQ